MENLDQPLSEKKIKPGLTALPEMVFVQGGAFIMGSNDGEDREKPVHRVVLDDFYIGKYPVTVFQFSAFIKETHYVTTAETEGSSYIFDGKDYTNKNGVNWERDIKGDPRKASDFNHPVIHVSWVDAEAYCGWLKQKTGKNYGLPTEAQWEYSARGGALSERYLYSGSNQIGDVAWYDGNSNNTTHAVGIKKSNELDVFDMSGNVWEWCGDWFDGDYYKKSPSHNPKGPESGVHRVNRGGGWGYLAANCRSSNRGTGAPTDRYESLGFRVASV